MLPHGIGHKRATREGGSAVAKVMVKKRQGITRFGVGGRLPGLLPVFCGADLAGGTVDKPGSGLHTERVEPVIAT